MSPAERGSKHACLDCGIKYYDLGRAVIACPRCGAKPQPVASKLPRAAHSLRKPGHTAFRRYP